MARIKPPSGNLEKLKLNLLVLGGAMENLFMLLEGAIVKTKSRKPRETDDC